MTVNIIETAGKYDATALIFILTLFYTLGLGIVVLHVRVFQPCGFSSDF
jgi:hypothetical protein